MDMILEKKDVMQAALQVWNEKIIPAELQLYLLKHRVIMKVFFMYSALNYCSQPHPNTLTPTHTH